jgi:hypothetical protein
MRNRVKINGIHAWVIGDRVLIYMYAPDNAADSKHDIDGILVGVHEWKSCSLIPSKQVGFGCYRAPPYISRLHPIPDKIRYQECNIMCFYVTVYLVTLSPYYVTLSYLFAAIHPVIISHFRSIHSATIYTEIHFYTSTTRIYYPCSHVPTKWSVYNRYITCNHYVKTSCNYMVAYYTYIGYSFYILYHSLLSHV